MVGTNGGGGSGVLGLSFRLWAIHFRSCVVVSLVRGRPHSRVVFFVF